MRLVLTKKGGSDTTMTWATAVEELLCFGWIDGQAGKRDEGSYTVRITPRRPKSNWSQRNVDLVATLEQQGRMTDAGRAAVEAARADGRWDAAYAGPATRQVPEDLAAAIAADPDAQAMLDVLTSANRFAVIHRVESMKRAESRARKIERDGDHAGARRYALSRRRPGHPGRADQAADRTLDGAQRRPLGCAMTKWEYLTAPILTHAAKQILDNFGSDGWELVQIAPGMNPENLVGYFKRPLEG